MYPELVYYHSAHFLHIVAYLENRRLRALMTKAAAEISRR